MKDRRSKGKVDPGLGQGHWLILIKTQIDNQMEHKQYR